MAPHVDVSIETVRTMGEDIKNLADEIHEALSKLSGTSKVVANYTQGFDCSVALGECESTWEDATDTLLVKLATTGDDMISSADEYVRRDTDATDQMTPLLDWATSWLQ